MIFANVTNEGSESRSEGEVSIAANSPYHIKAMEAAGKIVQDMTTILNESFPNTPVVLSVGNNDVVPDYYLELKEENTPLGNLSLAVEDAGMLGVIFQALSNTTTSEGKNKKAILTEDDEWTFLRGGYYSRSFHDGSLVVLSLNTVLYASFFEPTPMNADDPGKQFEWMRKMMSYSREMRGQVIIIGHIPPSLGSYRHNQFWKTTYVKTYFDIVAEFDDVIVAQLFGHLHSDEFRVGLPSSAHFNTDEETSLIPSMNAPLLLGPSVTPLHGNNPSFRLMKYGQDEDGSSRGKHRILDYESYRCLLDEESWSKLYTFSEAYSSSSKILSNEGLSSNTLRAIVESMEDDADGGESHVLKSFRSFLMSGADGTSDHTGANVDCNAECRDEWMCTFQSATQQGYEGCLRRRSQRKGSSIVGIVGACVFVVVLSSAVFIRMRISRKRRHYSTAPSAHGKEVEAVEAHGGDEVL